MSITTREMSSATCRARVTVVISLIASGMFPAISRAQNAPPQVHAIVSPAAYERILNIIFPVREPQANMTQYAMALRFMPSNHAESQIWIEVSTSGTARAHLIGISGPSAWRTANEYIQRNGREDVEQIVNLIHTKDQEVRITVNQARTWYTNCLKSLRDSTSELEKDSNAFQKTGEATIFLDGSIYDLKLTQNTTEAHWRMMDEEVNDTRPSGRSALAIWMNVVRRYALEHASK